MRKCNKFMMGRTEQELLGASSGRHNYGLMSYENWFRIEEVHVIKRVFI